MRFLVLAALRAILALAEEYSFWEDDAQVQVEASRPNSFLACSTTTLEELREAVMRPGAEDVIDAREGIADKLRQAWKTWRVSRATRSFVLPTQPVHVECVLELECLQAQGCDEVLFLLPFHEAMQVNGIVVTDDERKDSLGVLQISGQSVVDVKCSHNFPDDGDPPTPLELNEDYCRTACHPGVYGIRIADGVPHGESTRIRVSYNLGKAFSPQQSTLPRGQQQRVIFATTTLIPSPYHVALQLTRFAALDELNIRLMWLNTYGNLEEDAENEYVCGPFEKVELLSYGEHLAFSLDFHDSLEFIPWLHTRVHVPLWPLSDHMDIFEEYVVHNDASPFQVRRPNMVSNECRGIFQN
ncbi:dolichyl-diphosphooligosaccharide--protein glycosyltransferase subunit 1, putative [Babesia caballi]|uniref:Dolichyl-diphosphooligosaccharide--protein glycosyltransferase subunit 1, putative n=1 Tax=Babesia caballi TaxID=5871 RepID=A0AAV4LPM9_BABCB|nr:dolichyl-diphosphooligosaccharide--protein glycosyltransferase subunit 1, putative [Babesia caballi]